MPLSDVAHNRMLDNLLRASGGTYTVGLLRTTRLTAAVASGATSCAVSRAVAVGDYISLNDGANRNVFKVGSVANGGLTVSSFVAGPGVTGTATTAAFGNNTAVGVAPKASASIAAAESSASRVAITWTAAATEKIAANTGTEIKLSVPTGNEIGAFAIFDSTSTFLGSFLTNNIEGFGAQGDYILTSAEVSLAS